MLMIKAMKAVRSLLLILIMMAGSTFIWQIFLRTFCLETMLVPHLWILRKAQDFLLIGAQVGLVLLGATMIMMDIWICL